MMGRGVRHLVCGQVTPKDAFRTDSCGGLYCVACNKFDNKASFMDAVTHKDIGENEYDTREKAG